MPRTAQPPVHLGADDLRRRLTPGQTPAWVDAHAFPDSDDELKRLAPDLEWRTHPEAWTLGHREVNCVLASARLERASSRGRPLWAQVILGFGHSGIVGGWHFCGLDFHPDRDQPDTHVAGGFISATRSLDDALQEANSALAQRLAEGFLPVERGPTRFGRLTFAAAVAAHPRRRASPE